MKRFALPNTDLEVSQLGYGMGSFDSSFPIEDGLNRVARYIEAGGNFLDTAHCYGFWIEGGEGANDRFVGAAVRKFGRNNLVIATKGGHTGVPGYPRPDAFLAPELVSRDLGESLDRMGLPSVDLYFLHRDDPRVPAGELIEALNEHVASGRARYLGASNWAVERYIEANEHAIAKGLQPFALLQNQWSLAQPHWTDLTSPGAVRYIEDGDLQSLRERNIPVAAYGSTANGYFATGGKRGTGFESDQGRRRLAAAEELAKRKQATPNQIALAYLLNQPSLVIPLIGTRDEAHLIDALGASEIRLTPEEIELLRAGP